MDGRKRKKIDTTDVYDVQEIIDQRCGPQEEEKKGGKGKHKLQRGEEKKGEKGQQKIQYRIRWVGYGADDDTWEDEDNLSCPLKLEQFKKNQENKKSASTKADSGESPNNSTVLPWTLLSKTSQLAQVQVKKGITSTTNSRNLPNPTPKKLTLSKTCEPKKVGKAPFGAIMGYYDGVSAHSSNYKSADRSVWTKSAFRGEWNGLYYGYRFQCVEFARRWLIHAKGLTFENVRMAYQIFPISHAKPVPGGSPIAVPWRNVPNGSSESDRPRDGSILIWNQGGYYKKTGHVAVVTYVSDSLVRIAEQNIDDRYWPEGQNWCRELDVRVVQGRFYIDERKNGTVLGWKNLPPNFIPHPIPVPAES